jgi:uncharacterized protein
VKLYRVTGERKYLELSKFLLDCRGRYFDEAKRQPNPYYADHQPVTEQREAVGHAVRTAYMYASMADVAALTGDAAYLAAIDRLWENVVFKKMHLTGGIGALRAGEAFGADYELPNASAYLETCAAIANGLWNHRMFLLHGHARYIDVLERILYNGFLSGVGMTGDRFFYPNPLEHDGTSRFNQGHTERAPWFGCSCCPVNVVRFIPSIAGYAYATRGDELFVNLFLAGSAEAVVSGTPIKMTQETRYPWDGKVTLTVAPERAKEFALNVRIPGWARNEPVPGDLYRYDDSLAPQTRLSVNGKRMDLKRASGALQITNGFARITRTWKPGDRVTLELEMPVRRVAAHPSVQANANRFAIERGPLVYCAEGADNAGAVLDKIFPGKVKFSTQEKPGLLGGIVTVQFASASGGARLTAIPYYAWGHRGANEMRVWFPMQAEVKLASHCWPPDSAEACWDGIEPQSSGDHSIPRFTWWDRRGSVEWIERRFERPATISSTAVYWFDDTGSGGCRVPQSWRVLFKRGNDWLPVKPRGEFGVQRDRFNQIEFEPVETTALRVEVQLQPGYSGGILEWRIP